MNVLIPLIPLLPLIGFVVTGLFGRAFPGTIHRVAIAAVVSSWAIAMVVVFGALAHVGIDVKGIDVKLWT